jgi:hypothetical protein
LCGCELMVPAPNTRAAQQAARDRGWRDSETDMCGGWKGWLCPVCAQKRRQEQIAQLKDEIAKLEAEG